jgi:hypothetical protein
MQKSNVNIDHKIYHNIPLSRRYVFTDISIINKAKNTLAAIQALQMKSLMMRNETKIKTVEKANIKVMTTFHIIIKFYKMVQKYI